MLPVLGASLNRKPFDASVAEYVHSGGSPLAAGRSSRNPTSSRREADGYLLHSDRLCHLCFEAFFNPPCGAIEMMGWESALIFQ